MKVYGDDSRDADVLYRTGRSLLVLRDGSGDDRG